MANFNAIVSLRTVRRVISPYTFQMVAIVDMMQGSCGSFFKRIEVTIRKCRFHMKRESVTARSTVDNTHTLARE